MRSIPAGSFDRLSSPLGLWRAFVRCRRGKRVRAAVARFDLDADTLLLSLSRRLQSGTYRPGPFHLHVVHDPKRRLIAAAPFGDRVVHEALVAELGPHLGRRFIDHSYGCKTGRGPHRAALQFLEWTRQRRYRLSLDVRRYFPSIHLETLAGLWCRGLGDPRTAALIGYILEAGSRVYRAPAAIATLGLDEDPLGPGCGLAIGSYFSHFSGALYLDGLDHFVKRELRVRCYLRYMDDFSLFGDDRDALLEARARIAEWLLRERRLELNPKRWEVTSTREPVEYLGFRINPTGLFPGKKMKRRMPEKLREAARKGPRTLERTVRSYRGLVTFG